MAAASPSAVFMTDLKVNMTPDTVSIRTSSTVNSYGERSFSGDATTYDAYVVRVEASDRTVNNDLVDVDYVVYIPDASLTMRVDDQITLPAPISATRPIVRVNIKKDPLGQVGVIIYCGSHTRRAG